jgi:hypothetical protein
VLAESEIRVVYLSTEFFNRPADSLKAILGVSDEPGPGFWGVTYLMKKKRHGRSPFGAEILGDGRNMRLKNIGVKVEKASENCASGRRANRFAVGGRIDSGLARGEMGDGSNYSRELCTDRGRG